MDHCPHLCCFNHNILFKVIHTDMHFMKTGGNNGRNVVMATTKT